MIEARVLHRFPTGFALDAAFRGDGLTVLFGPSGCGKSSLLAAVAGLLRPAGGRIALAGEAPWFDGAARLFVPPERRRAATVFQDARLFPHLSVRANLRYGGRRAPHGAPGPGEAEVVDLLGIAPLLDRRPARLSGGERQRVALARALLARPRLLLLDEPLAALDAPRRAEAMGLIERVRDAFGIPMLYVTHALDEVDRLADHLVLLRDGKVLAEGAAEALSLRTDLPLAARRDAGVLLPCVIAEHVPARGLTRLDFPGGHLWVPPRPEPVGTRLRLRLRARDVALATETPRGISIHNILPATVEAIQPAGPGADFVRVAVGPTPLLARVTTDSVARLGLEPGRAVVALVKTVVFDHAQL
ncbi:MAG: molybdenum ABC transporter ATP-binding protein [Acetobacteraceae bacterium]|nr:molybdenum ABC transporter ATP-binding protein [Acetobacteraceae bacterium]